MKNIGIVGIIVLFAVILGYGIFFSQKTAPDATGVLPTPTNAQALTSDKTTNVTGEMVDYFQGIKGYYATPDEATLPDAGYPGVVMIHEWWGLNQQIKDMADTLAKEGYQVLAVDLYKGTMARSQEEAKTQTSQLNQTEALENLKAAVAFLREKEAPKIASLGWCFGGGQSLQLSTSGEKLDGTIIYYGNLTSDTAKLKNIQWPVLGIFGQEDASIPPAAVNEFEAALNRLNIQNSITIYPGVGHAFANPTGQNYAPEETKDAWSKTLLFLDTNLGEKPTPTAF